MEQAVFEDPLKEFPPSAVKEEESEQLFFEDLFDGLSFEGSVLVTGDMIADFTKFSGDANMAHQKVAHGALLASLVSGIVSAFLGSSIGRMPILLQDRNDFAGAVRAGNTFLVKGKVIQLLNENNRRGRAFIDVEGFNEKGAVVLYGHYKVLVPRRNHIVS